MATDEDEHFFGTFFGVCLFYLVEGMKRLVCVICAWVLLLSGCSDPSINLSRCEDTANNTQDIYELRFNTKELDNNSVGDEWAITYTYNGETVRNGLQIMLPLGETSLETVEVEIIERDTINDVGAGVLNIQIYDGSYTRTEVKVVENAGRYKGNSALWEITCTVKLVGSE